MPRRMALFDIRPYHEPAMMSCVSPVRWIIIDRHWASRACNGPATPGGTAAAPLVEHRYVFHHVIAQHAHELGVRCISSIQPRARPI